MNAPGFHIMRKLIFITAAIVAAGMLAASAGHTGSRRAKARHYLMESSVQLSAGNHDAAYELARRAHRTDPAYPEAAMSFGISHIGLQLDSASEYADPLELIRTYVDAHPTDYTGSRIYAALAVELGRPAEAMRVYERNESIFPQKSADLISLANVYISQDSTTEAIRAIDRYETLEGKSSLLSVHKISMLLGRKDTVGALAEADSLIAYNPSEPENYLVKGNTYLYLGARDSAMAYYERAERIDPESGQPKVAMANYWLAAGDTARYDSKIYEALMSNGYDKDEKMQLLTAYMAKLINDNSNSGRAAVLFKALTDQYPHEPDVMWLVSEYLAVKKNYAEAAEKISYAIGLDPENTHYRERLMQYWIGAEDYPKAEAAYTEAARKVEPTDAMTYLRAAAFQLADRYDDAIKVYNDLIRAAAPGLSALDTVLTASATEGMSRELRMRLSSLYTSVGDATQLKKDTTATFNAYANALIFFPDNTLALNNYAYLLAESGGDLNEAERMASRAVRIEEENPIYLDTYAWILFKKGEYKLAMPYQSVAVEKSSAEPQAELYDHFGDILFMAGEPERALENWQKALELDPGNEKIRRKVKQKTYVN